MKTVQRKKASEAAVHQRDLLVPCSSEPVVRGSLECFVTVTFTSLLLTYSLIDEAVTLTRVRMTCLLCAAVKVQVYVPECFSTSGLSSRSDPSPSWSASWSSSL